MSIEAAQYRLRQGSSISTIKISVNNLNQPAFLPGKPGEYDAVLAEYEEVQKIKRALAVLRVFKNAATPTYKRGLRTVFKFAAAVGGSAASAREALKGAAKGLQKYVILNNFGRAYREDVRRHLDALSKNGTSPTASDWLRWDKPLNDACDSMAKFIEGRHHCLPKG